MFDMLVPGSFQDIGHQAWDKKAQTMWNNVTQIKWKSKKLNWTSVYALRQCIEHWRKFINNYDYLSHPGTVITPQISKKKVTSVFYEL